MNKDYLYCDECNKRIRRDDHYSCGRCGKILCEDCIYEALSDSPHAYVCGDCQMELIGWEEEA
jgi:DNA-directed RNA polymerase subunit RPC12/RpoP